MDLQWFTNINQGTIIVTCMIVLMAACSFYCWLTLSFWAVCGRLWYSEGILVFFFILFGFVSFFSQARSDVPRALGQDNKFTGCKCCPGLQPSSSSSALIFPPSRISVLWGFAVTPAVLFLFLIHHLPWGLLFREIQAFISFKNSGVRISCSDTRCGFRGRCSSSVRRDGPILLFALL